MQFSSFDVEQRPRVKCVSAKTGVPITTQWDKKGYYYATQISQFALAHWSKELQLKSDDSKNSTTFEDGNNTFNADWIGAEINRVSRDKCVHFDSPTSLKLNRYFPGLQILTFDLLIRDQPSVTVRLNHDKFGAYNIRYSSKSNKAISRAGRTITLGFVGDYPEGTWKSFTRNLINDLDKGLQSQDALSKSMKQSQTWKMEAIDFEGVGCVTNISLSKEHHLRLFYHAADWLVQNQNPNTGAWHVDVPFNLGKSKYPMAEEIPKGWISGMGSGHAISVLSRAYKKSGNKKYIIAAMKAISPFKSYTHEGGLKASFLNKYEWYEEYPTKPYAVSLLVLIIFSRN